MGRWLAAATLAIATLTALPAVADPLPITVTAIRPSLRTIRDPHPRPIVVPTRAELRRQAKQRKTLLAKVDTLSPEEAHTMGMRYFDRKADDRDPELAIVLFESAAVRGHKPSRQMLADMGDSYARAAYWRDELARDGGVTDWMLAGDGYAALTFDSLNDARAAGWYTKAAEGGDIRAQMWLGRRYSGISDHRDALLAVHWYGRAAAQGNANAMYLIARLYMGEPGPDAHYGDQTELRDPMQAIAWYARAAMAGDSGGTAKVCGWPADDVRSVFTEAMTRCVALYDAGKGLYTTDQIRLGVMLFKGDPIGQDYAKAWKLLERTRTPEAYYYKARMKIEGLGTEAAPAIGWAWMSLAARQGDPQAQAWLRDHPVPADLSRGEYDVSKFPIDGAGPTPPGLTGDGDYYPSRAVEDEIEGRALIRCQWVAGRPAACQVLAEDPAGYGFGAASLRMMEKSNPSVTPSEAWKAETAGKWSDFEIVWQLSK